MYFRPDLANFRVFRVGHTLDQVVDSVEELFELPINGGYRTSSGMAGGCSREGGVHDSHPIVISYLIVLVRAPAIQSVGTLYQRRIFLTAATIASPSARADCRAAPPTVSRECRAGRRRCAPASLPRRQIRSARRRRPTRDGWPTAERGC